MKHALKITTAIASLTLFGLALVSCVNVQTRTQQDSPTLIFDQNTYQKKQFVFDNKTIQVRAYENIPYVVSPIEPDYQLINIYIPEEYFANQTINGYTKDTAPIFSPNAIGGYMPAKPMDLSDKKSPDGQISPSSVQMALSRGYIVASIGARGRTLQKDGVYTGKAPAAIVDLKAGIRYLKANDKQMFGDANKIIVNGTSAGGAMTALLGATGNHPDYKMELQKIGAIRAKDNVFAVSSYCPITNLENADAAYEWQMNKINDYKKITIKSLDYQVKRETISGTLDKNSQDISLQLKQNFPKYINGLNLIGKNGNLTLDKDGNGTFKDEILYYLNQSVNKAHKDGIPLSEYTFLNQKKSIKPYYIANFDDFLQTYLGRQKTPPAFDALDLPSGENNLFGSDTIDNRHFTNFAKNFDNHHKHAPKNTVKLMNPMNYLDDNNAEIAQYWRIRHGAKDADTGFAISVILATKLQMNHKTVDFFMPWNQGHGGDYDLNELFDWIDSISKETSKK
ncbi:MAG: subtype B tannase [Moraxella sp.]